jgi:hypothetical protein
VFVWSKDKRRWEVKERWRRRSEEVGGCIRQQVADALWELSGKYDVFCGVVVNGVRLSQPHCRTVEDCVRQILEDYRREVEKMKEPPPPPDPAEELLREWPELGTFGTEWVRKWVF